jgi:hypothetical protein
MDVKGSSHGLTYGTIQPTAQTEDSHEKCQFQDRTVSFWAQQKAGMLPTQL